MTATCDCGETIQRLPDGSQPEACYRCLGGTREHRDRLAKAQAPKPAPRARGKAVPPAPRRGPWPSRAEPLDDETVEAGRAGVAAAREALRQARWP